MSCYMYVKELQDRKVDYGIQVYEYEKGTRQMIWKWLRSPNGERVSAISVHKAKAMASTMLPHIHEDAIRVQEILK